MKNLICLFTVLFVLLSCNKIKEKETQAIHGNQASRPLELLIFDVVHKGDSLAYYELSNVYFDYRYETFLPYALIMANKYNYPQAYFDVYDCLLLACEKDSFNICLLDTVTQKMAIEYLRQASLKGHSQARETLGEYYMQGTYFERDTILGKQLIEQAKHLPY
jgi:TPR repeat protein